ncbi:MAG: phosphatase [Rhodothermales bacterium]|nr:phosphatase [Rhodothermales bacterium]
MRPFIMFLLAALTAGPASAQTVAEDSLAAVYNYVRVNDQLATAGQLTPSQIAYLGEAGYELVVNLAVADEARNGREGFEVIEQGISYVHIPVSWREPSMRDLEMFFDVMEANRDRKVFVHCFANMRASAFTFLYRTLVEGVDESAAREAMDPVWDPMELEQWAGLIERAQAEYGGDR